MVNELHDLGDIKELTYLVASNNPWQYKGNIENLLNNSSEKEFFQIFHEICFVYQKNSGLDDKFFQWYFEEIFERRVIDSEIETKKFGKKGEGIADSFVQKRKEIHNQYLEDVRRIYVLWKEVGIKKGFSISFYPNDLYEIFN
jgi:hypothetical protein